MTLPEIRKKIDALDTQLLDLLNRRADLVHEVGILKKRDGVAIYAPEREEQLLRSLAEKLAQKGGRLPESAIRAIYREIISASYALEKGLVIAHLGPAAAETHQAARQKFGASVDYAPQPGIADVFQAVARGEADYGVAPIEDSTGGTVTGALDALAESDLKICAQVLLKTECHLAAKTAKIPRSRIRKIYSDPQAFGQCRAWLQRHFPHAVLIEVSSTARAAELAASEPEAEAGTAAITGPMAAEISGLEILARSIQDAPVGGHAKARFLVLGHEMCPPTGRDETSLIFEMPDKPGALFSAIEPLQRREVSIRKIESRLRRRGAPFFFAEVEGHAQEPPLAEALAEMEKRGAAVKILGSYPQPPAVG